MLSYKRYACKSTATLPLTPTIDNQAWCITGREKAEYIEASSFPEYGANSPDHVASSCRYARLAEDEILDWVYQRGDYVPRINQDTGNEIQARIRLLVLERTYYQPPSFHIRKETYSAIEKHFALPEDTLFTLSNEGGMSTHTLDVDEVTGALKRLSMVIKAQQKFQVANYGLAFSYDFTTGVSTGILYGTGVGRHTEDYELWIKHAAAEMFEHIKTAHQFWAHPLCLPLMLLQHHLLRADYFCTVVLPERHIDVERQLGVVRAGRLYGTQTRNIAAELPVQQARLNLVELTAELSSLMFDSIWFQKVSDWQCSCLKHLLEVLTEIENTGTDPFKKTSPMRAKIRYWISFAEGINRHVTATKENGQTDMNALYNIMSQVDNRLSAKMAAASSHDSAAMKTLAFLTALFLPGTFIATVFSTGFFDWEDSGMAVAKSFWVYWAVSVPLTVIVAVGWRLWWNLEKRRFDEDIKAEIDAINGNSRIVDVTSKAF